MEKYAMVRVERSGAMGERLMRWAFLFSSQTGLADRTGMVPMLRLSSAKSVCARTPLDRDKSVELRSILTNARRGAKENIGHLNGSIGALTPGPEKPRLRDAAISGQTKGDALAS